MNLEPRRSRGAQRALALLALTTLVPLGAGACTSFSSAVADVGYFDFAGATRVCARVFSCPRLATSLRQSLVAPIDDVNFSTCMSWLAGPSPAPPRGFTAQAEALAGVASATTCDEAARDLDVSPLADDDPRCASGADACLPSGDVLDCHARRLVRCPGTQFVPSSKCRSEGAFASCSIVLGSESCVGTVPLCSGSVYSACDEASALREAIDCAPFGEACLDSSQAVVFGPGLKNKLSICTSSDNTSPQKLCDDATGEGWMGCSADGGSVVLCNHLTKVKTVTFGGVEVLYGCQTSLGWTCRDGIAGSIPYCERPDAECSPSDADVNRCDGDTLHVCLAGRRADIDCGAVGATCQKDADRGGHCAFAP
ncbi:MAG: hypothetical protein QM820_50380 [Minicystis sp.]